MESETFRGSDAVSSLAVEQRGIEYIDEDKRHGRPNNQFTIRFSPVIYLAPIVVGGIAIPLGLGLAGSVTAIVLGNILGAAGTAACSAMGPRLGMPQLTMSRSAFGYRGNYLPAALSTLLFIGYFIVGTILGAQSLADLFHAPYVPIAIIVAALSILIAVFGYNLLHVFGRWITAISIAMLIAVTIVLALHGTGTGAAGTLHGGDYWLTWLLEFTVVFGYTVSWAPYASDYSRYLPHSTKRRATFGWAFSGLFIGTTWMMIVGATVLTINPTGTVLSAFGRALPGPLLVIVLIVFGIAALPHNAANLYSNAMASMTWDLPLKRTVTVVVGGIIGGVLAIFLGGPGFVNNFEGFLFLVTYYVMPWIAILGIDFYWNHRRGHAYPDIDNFYLRHGGRFGEVRWLGLVAFVVGIGVSVPFMATTFYTGPVGHALGGADLSYFVSFIVAGVIYLALSMATSRDAPRQVGLAQASESRKIKWPRQLTPGSAPEAARRSYE
ncbi:MAG: purine-cytosine permease family protein [Sciscionella sp.]